MASTQRMAPPYLEAEAGGVVTLPVVVIAVGAVVPAGWLEVLAG